MTSIEFWQRYAERFSTTPEAIADDRVRAEAFVLALHGMVADIGERLVPALRKLTEAYRSFFASVGGIR